MWLRPRTSKSKLLDSSFVYTAGRPVGKHCRSPPLTAHVNPLLSIANGSFMAGESSMQLRFRTSQFTFMRRGWSYNITSGRPDEITGKRDCSSWHNWKSQRIRPMEHDFTHGSFPKSRGHCGI